MAEEQNFSKSTVKHFTRLVFGNTKITVIARNSVNLFTRHYTSLGCSVFSVLLFDGLMNSASSQRGQTFYPAAHQAE